MVEPDHSDELPTASLAMLRQRSEVVREIRRFFEERGFWEVETPLLSRESVIDAHLKPFATATDGEPLYLQTSPEFAMKRLLAAGATAIFQITKAFRQEEIGRLHNPEFTILEWYRVGETHHDQMTFVEQLVRHIVTRFRLTPDEPESTVLGNSLPEWSEPFDRLEYDEAFKRFVGIGVLQRSSMALAALAGERGISPPPTMDVHDRDEWLNLLLAECVEPHLGVERPVFLYNYPASQGAPAANPPHDPTVAERFELYVNSIELCNGYHELTDAAEFERRTAEQAELQRRQGWPRLSPPRRFLAAMRRGLPPCAGTALGVDRLVMLALGANSLAEVLPFPFDRA